MPMFFMSSTTVQLLDKVWNEVFFPITFINCPSKLTMSSLARYIKLYTIYRKIGY